jgi:MFS family permease
MGTRARFHVMVVVAGVGFGLTAPLTALFAADLGASDLVAGLAVSSISISLLLVDFFGTRFVPRIDARLAMTVSLAVFGIGSIASAFASNVELMILARVGQGFGGALFMGGALQLAVRMAAGGAAEAIGAFNAAWFAGIALGPPLSTAIIDVGATELDGLRLAFGLCGLINLSGAVLVWVGLPRLPTGRPPAIGLPRLGGLRGWRGAGVLTQATLGQAVRSGIAMTMVPLFGHDQLGLSSLELGLALSALAVTDIAAMGISGRLAHRHGRLGVLATALAWGVVATIALSGTGSLWPFVLAAMAVGVTVGTTWVVPAAMAVDIAADPEAGLSSYRISSDIGMLLGGAAAGAAVSAAGPGGAFWWAAGVLGLGLVLALAVGETRPKQPPEHERGTDRRARAAATPNPATVEVTP